MFSAIIVWKGKSSKEFLEEPIFCSKKHFKRERINIHKTVVRKEWPDVMICPQERYWGILVMQLPFIFVRKEVSNVKNISEHKRYILRTRGVS